MTMIYFDNAATTQVSPEVAEVTQKYMRDCFGNASSSHAFGKKSRNAVDYASTQASFFLNASAQEIVFTSGGTEADNLALIGGALAYKDKGRHIITTKIEHPAVLRSCEFLERNGFEVTYLSPDNKGIVSVEDFHNSLRSDTILASVMYANNEVGTLQPVREIARICREREIVFHTDAVAAAGYISIDVKAENIDLLSFSGHKFHAPKGIGALYVREGVKLVPQSYGGMTGNGLRGGTENVPAIAALGKACEILSLGFSEKMSYLKKLRDKLLAQLENNFDFLILHGDREKRLPGNLCVAFPGFKGFELLKLLDEKGIAVSAGAACKAGCAAPSHVLSAMGVSGEVAGASLRVTLDTANTYEEVDYFIKVMKEVLG